MFVKLREIIYYFEQFSEFILNYFNIEDYKIYSLEEQQELLNSNIFEKKDFLMIPCKKYDDIIKDYLLQKNDRNLNKLIREQKYPDFHRKFHWYTEDNCLVQEWKNFERSNLIEFASLWCEEHNINFTLH